MMDAQQLHEVMQLLGQQARHAARLLGVSSALQRTDALHSMADALILDQEEILSANVQDVRDAQAKHLAASLIDRLHLDAARINAMAQGIRTIAAIADPLGVILDQTQQPNGLTIRKMSVPLGVIGIIYESRPNVTADAGALCIKAGNAVLLRGGSESVHSSQAIVRALHDGLRRAGLPEHAVQYVPIQDRAAVGIMLGMTQWIDVIIPRGGKSLTERIARDSHIPTIQHLDGNCHIYVHEQADSEKALRVIYNGKLRRTGICGATESLLIDAALAPRMIPLIIDQLDGVEIRADKAACAIDARLIPATEEDWGTEYLDRIISLKIVANLDEAIAHINHYGSHHTDAIITEDADIAAQFLHEIDSAIVMHNTSTQFADGGEFGMGAEIGISTGRLHARGPVGARELTTYKYVVASDGAVRA
ncbi:MAG: glutamate-5-semialdehyde dehydrogenase [Alphaproteobacteria bacterium]|nr:MAG: glutamate-5-semialdehyde dehydrogenase [Alphaproteobacteria bacterium]TAF12799.1 MAG: glutamate-5-semialdehyde dehydrogenase [Alphaproteobacteria bacterium]TAF38646.1 MAG: glutamate-5-semialdehyde dehydrogenase [Alphaproteobacteria bacterium]TAF75941.1 MAG: glutamate-5-semialdehyde dehydrogenase [Alphaproteobacteria bacterium]